MNEMEAAELRLLETMPPPNPKPRAIAIAVFYAASDYMECFSAPSELKIRCWAECFTRPWMSVALAEWAVHEHFKSGMDRMLPAHVNRIAAELLGVQR